MITTVMNIGHVEEWDYLTEGNANVIFRYTGERVDLLDSVIRIRKQTNQSSLITVEKRQQYLSDAVLPALQEARNYVLIGQAIKIDPDFFVSCNEKLQFSQHIRPAKYRYSQIFLQETHVVVLPYLKPSKDEMLLEFKPKWLAQSPNAPTDAELCRTCALRAMRSNGLVLEGFCPLDLASASPARVMQAMSAVNKEMSWCLAVPAMSRITAFLLENRLILDLRDAQIRAANDLSLCMTLRDCSLYLLMNKTSQEVVGAWIADFDQKDILAKQSYWTSIEHKLSSEGWYHASTMRMTSSSCLK